MLPVLALGLLFHGAPLTLIESPSLRPLDARRPRPAVWIGRASATGPDRLPLLIRPLDRVSPELAKEDPRQAKFECTILARKADPRFDANMVREAPKGFDEAIARTSICPR